MKKVHTIENLRFSGDTLSLIIDSVELKFNIKKISRSLLKATSEERSKFEISPSGYGIHWPLIDEDLSIDGLLGIVHSPEQVSQFV